MFRNVPKCSGMFRNVPCSGFCSRPNFLALGLSFLAFYHVIKKSAIVKRTPIGYDEGMYYGTPMPESKHYKTDQGGRCRLFFFFPGVAFELDFLKLFCVIYLSLLFFLSLHELFFLEFRLARFLFWDFCTPSLKYLMASPQQNSAK